jgi:hypothetical protein
MICQKKNNYIILLIVQVRTMKLEMEQSEQSHQKQVHKLEQSVR